MKDFKINITIEKENQLNDILDEILKLKEQEKEVNTIYKNMIKKIEKITKQIHILQSMQENLEEDLYNDKV